MAWQSDKSTMRRINELIREILRTPFSGKGKPGPLRFDKVGAWSRRINERDRLVYEVQDGAVIILQCKGHDDG